MNILDPNRPKKKRQSFPPIPPPVDTEELRAAQAIAVAVSQGLPGAQFARLMNVMDSAAVQKAAAISIPDLVAWFKQDAGAAAILNQVPGFDAFAKAFHDEARTLYPQAPGLL